MQCPTCKSDKIATIDLQFSMEAKRYFKTKDVSYVCDNRHKFDDAIVVKIPKRRAIKNGAI